MSKYQEYLDMRRKANQAQPVLRDKDNQVIATLHEDGDFRYWSRKTNTYTIISKEDAKLFADWILEIV